MWITHHIAARTFVWLAVVTIPVQSLPSVACDCTSGMTCSVEGEQSQGCCCASSCCGIQTPGSCRCTSAKVCRCDEASSCHQQSRTCCSGKKATNSCCSDDKSTNGCSCGDNCQCGENNTPAEPAVPPVDNSSSKRILVESAATDSSATAYLPSATTRQHLDVQAGVDALSTLDRCVTLCRFTI